MDFDCSSSCSLLFYYFHCFLFGCRFHPLRNFQGLKIPQWMKSVDKKKIIKIIRVQCVFCEFNVFVDIYLIGVLFDIGVEKANVYYLIK